MRIDSRQDQTWRPKRRSRLHPAQASVLAFAAVAFVGTGLLWLPVATQDGTSQFMPALFTSFSAVCVTGLSTVDVPNHWSTFGELVILVLIQIGGIGAMSLATILSLLVFASWASPAASLPQQKPRPTASGVCVACCCAC